MRRREFVIKSALTMGGIAAGGTRLLAQPGASRAAVVIGVNKAGNLPILRGAASDALKVDAWLRDEGFATTALVDERDATSRASIRANDVYDAVAAFVDQGTVELLVIYFSGHGFVKNNSEFWLLSNAPDNPNEAISHIESKELAHRCGIPNVVFISDACRSTIGSLDASGVHGSLMFSTRGNAAVKTDVDLFLATGLGQDANEVSMSADAFAGIYTAAFLSAFVHPDPAMVRTVSGLEVVPNRQLKPYLLREVQARLRALPEAHEQAPDTYVVSDDDVYIGRVTGTASPIILTDREAAVSEVASTELDRVGFRGLAGVPAATGRGRGRGTAVDAAPATSRFRAVKAQIPEPPSPSTLGLRSGFTVSGAVVNAVIAGQGLRARLLEPGGGYTRIEVEGGRPGSVALDFGGFGTVVAALPDYVGSVVVASGQVVSVSYLPSYFNGSELTHLHELHATVGTATQFGVFRIEADRARRSQAAAELAGSIRVMKGVDPTLGLYAAYAYADADIIEQVRSVMNYMRSDLQADFFDVAMLAGVLEGRNPADNTAPPVVPCCPMLSQGWNLLRVRGVNLAPELMAARDSVRQALWTTFDGAGLERVTALITNGRVR